MPEFTASDPGSSFPSQNILFNSASGLTGQELQKNQLAIQGQQLDLSAADHEQVGRLAAGLLNEPDPARRADLYARGVGMLQSQGLAKYAPPTLPDEGVLRSLVSQSVPVTDQYKLGIATPPGTTAAISAALTPGQPGYGGTGATATPTTTPPGSGATIGQRQNNPGNLTFAGQPGASPGQGNRFASFPDMPSGVAATADQLALYQTQHNINTVRGAVTRWVSDPKADLTSYIGDISKALGVGPDDKIDLTNPDVQAKFIQAQFPHESAGGGYVLNPADVAKGVQMAAANRGRAVQAPGTAIAAAAPAGGGGTPGSYQVASTAPTAPPGSTAAPGGPAQPAPVPPPASSQANLPHASSVPTGASSPQYQQAMDLQRRAMILDAQPDPTGRLKTLAAGLRSQAALALQNDSVVNTQEGQLHTLTGKLDDPAKPLADYHETTPGSGIWVGGPGTEPKFQPPGRLIIDKAGDVWRTTTGGAEKLSRLDPAAVAALNEAAAAGTATGTAVAKQLPELMAQARNAAAQEGQIDYATNQLREATKGGIPTGYFSQGLATAAAAAKSLGLTDALRAVGVNPEAVGNVQTAQKTLSVIGGAILRQALGPGSAVTDAKVEQFIHTQPGIETDPQALQRIMAWARSQFTYERELGTAAVAEAAKPENAGRLPPHFLAAYYRDHGFAPIYDTGTQEMRQPDGRQPERETPQSAGAIPVMQSPSDAEKLPVGTKYQTPDGRHFVR